MGALIGSLLVPAAATAGFPSSRCIRSARAREYLDFRWP
jgi:hypothetical protein